MEKRGPTIHSRSFAIMLGGPIWPCHGQHNTRRPPVVSPLDLIVHRANGACLLVLESSPKSRERSRLAAHSFIHTQGQAPKALEVQAAAQPVGPRATHPSPDHRNTGVLMTRRLFTLLDLVELPGLRHDT
ncbi:hypothetical protein B0T26DRAFT_253466 [Lasiosphaeria miniovina]|uniref:Uncharacterized protein n=1 Tax=Lasiosphaeria miniovina TaxID=1954250 RepID=A0AA40AWE2_9PEZI|nr:uncharacterized protein B0T26DRAFT_253466 [Lasiosphaeria miniovina]KAK0723166.1 hypothetical protein B0T26DRAFT_253466 [Lasiosphaeria miniovina]